MSSAADSDLIRRDTALPGLATLLDPHALATLIASRDSQPLHSLDLLYLRYKPGTNCVAAYLAGNNAGTTLLYAKAHGGDAAVKLSKARRSPGRARAGPPERVFAPSLGIVVFGFPDDLKLPVLSRLADPPSRRRLLVRVLGEDAVTSQEGLETLAYKPERRYVARFASERADGGVVLKFYGRERALESRDGLLLAQKCGGSKRHGVLAHRWLPGRTLRETFDSGDAPDLGRVGAAIAELHAQRNADLPVRSVTARLSDLAVLAQTLGFIYPAVCDDAHHLAERIASRLAAQETITTAIHGDLYDKQIVMCEGQVGLVDLDEATRGDVRQDLGLFMAHLERDRLMGRPIEGIETIGGSLLEGYQHVAGARIDGIAPFVAEGLFRLAHHPFRRHGPGWPEHTKAILERVTELLADCSRLR
ncbi:MAG: phosphotransferase [Deltaproteobacteria bacterium]|nr:phosphotransferase [Deltaproteobacteria bacterium]